MTTNPHYANPCEREDCREMRASLAKREPGADTGTTPPPDVWTCEACGYKSDDIGEYREVCGKCFSAAAERGTTPPEGLSEAQIKKLVNDIGNAAALFSMEYHEAHTQGTYLDYGLDSRIEPIIRAATQRAPVTMRNCGICGKPFRDDDGKGFCTCVLD